MARHGSSDFSIAVGTHPCSSLPLMANPRNLHCDNFVIMAESD